MSSTPKTTGLSNVAFDHVDGIMDLSCKYQTMLPNLPKLGAFIHTLKFDDEGIAIGHASDALGLSIVERQLFECEVVLNQGVGIVSKLLNLAAEEVNAKDIEAATLLISGLNGLTTAVKQGLTDIEAAGVVEREAGHE